MKRALVLLLVAGVLFASYGACQGKVSAVSKSIVKIGEDAGVAAGEKVKDVVAVNGNVYVKGEVEKDVVAVLGTVHLYPTARVGGDVVAVGGSVMRHMGAVVKGDITEVGGEGTNRLIAVAPAIAFISVAGLILLKILMIIGFLALALVLVAFMTKHIGVISGRVEKNWWKTLLWGLAGSIATPFITFFLIASIVGIPLILVEMVLLSMAFILGFIAVAQIVGKYVFKTFKTHDKPMILEVVLGLVILFIIDLIPFIGGLVKALVLLMGFGGAIITKLGFEK